MTLLYFAVVFLISIIAYRFLGIRFLAIILLGATMGYFLLVMLIQRQMPSG